MVVSFYSCRPGCHREGWYRDVHLSRRSTAGGTEPSEIEIDIKDGLVIILGPKEETLAYVALFVVSFSWGVWAGCLGVRVIFKKALSKRRTSHVLSYLLKGGSDRVFEHDPRNGLCIGRRSQRAIISPIFCRIGCNISIHNFNT